jgi:iron(III) transport system ATP-binding protein
MAADLQIVNLTKEFESFDQPGNKVVAVDDVSLDVEKGELVTLLGPSGCGKTTLLRMIAGFEDPTRGDIYLSGQRVNDQAPNQRNAAMVFQSYALFPHLNVLENVVFGLRLQRIPSSEVTERGEKVLELVGLGGLGERATSQLSGGQQQRVALARAIVMEPSILLFDEPLSNLDAKLREQMRIEIRQLQQRVGITSVYVTHDQAEAMSMSDRIVVMNYGRIMQVGSPLDIYAKPRNRFVADFIGKVNFLTAQISGPKQARLLDQELTVDDLDERPPGQEVVLTIRPEAINLLATGGHLSGQITRATFLGGLVEYEIQVDRLGEALVVHDANPVVRGLHQVGETVELELPAKALHALAEG